MKNKLTLMYIKYVNHKHNLSLLFRIPKVKNVLSVQFLIYLISYSLALVFILEIIHCALHGYSNFVALHNLIYIYGGKGIKHFMKGNKKTNSK